MPVFPITLKFARADPKLWSSYLLASEVLLPEIDSPGRLGPPVGHVPLLSTTALLSSFSPACCFLSHKWKSTKTKFDLELF